MSIRGSLKRKKEGQTEKKTRRKFNYTKEIYEWEWKFISIVLRGKFGWGDRSESMANETKRRVDNVRKGKIKKYTQERDIEA